jgi:dynein light intermediate chain 1
MINQPRPTDTLARISLYLLSTPSPSFTPLIKPLLTPETIPNTLIVILLDWSQPHLWLRQLQEWTLMLRDILQSLDADCMEAMQEVMISWRDRGRTGSSVNIDGTGAVQGEDEGALPLGPSEWEDALGLPLCVVCQNVRSRRKISGGAAAFYQECLANYSSP